MDYLLLFLEGIITFISPCLLPLIPVYVSYFAGQRSEGKKQTAFVNSLGFVLGFTVVFVILGVFAGSVGRLLKDFQVAINIVGGVIVILFGLNFMEVIRIPFLNGSRRMQFKNATPGFFSSILFGIIFSIGWSPCVGAFLGSALSLAAAKGGSVNGILMLLTFSLGLGIPFVASAVLIDKLKGAFDFIKRNYRIINLISGGLLVLVGILMTAGLMGYFTALLTF